MTSPFHDIAEEILDYLVENIDNVPTNQFVAHSQIVHDCPGALAIMLSNITTTPNQCTSIPAVTYTVEMTRCITNLVNSGLPGSDTVTQDSLSLLVDAYNLWLALAQGRSNGELSPTVGTCSQITLGPLTAFWSGDVAGWRITVTVSPAG